ncbi:hypothetical protein KPH14_000981 [Odynerus spinipes]|uniref:Lipocalin/cytosolic fatty-acid binding domain-containing protein n=1 Tax=Odynerus spinipes TaxID=1348599 RepID=A0AAD9RGJ2_9HYME|nr:hypothetical protein KPH14_000981 [Odynerus spinipes]
MHTFGILGLLIAVSYWDVCTAKCPSESGLPLDLNQFSGKWYMVAGTPVNGKSLSKCGYFVVSKTSSTTFMARYTALSYKDNKPVTFNVDGSLRHDITGYWQLRGSDRILGGS